MLGKLPLKDIRTRAPSTTLLAYVDLQTQMVLSADADPVPMQEELNELATMASDVFLGQDTSQIVEALGWTGAVSMVVLQNGAGTTAFVRGDREGDDAFCAVGTVSANLSELLGSAAEGLRSLEHANN